MRLKDKVIVVTGSTTGIGRAIAECCVAEGARVVIHGIEEDLGRQTVEKLGRDRASLILANLADAGAADRITAAALSAFGRIDGLVNNAALTSRSHIDATDAAFFDRMMAVNARAPLLLIRAMLPELEKNRGGVVNIGSVNAYGGLAKLLAYSMSKAALMTLSRNLANALGVRGVRVNHLNPGWVLSENEYRYMIADGMEEGWPDRLPKEEIPSGKMTSPADVASHVAFWLSDESRPISGAVLELCQYSFLGRFNEELP